MYSSTELRVGCFRPLTSTSFRNAPQAQCAPARALCARACPRTAGSLRNHHSTDRNQSYQTARIRSHKLRCSAMNIEDGVAATSEPLVNIGVTTSQVVSSQTFEPQGPGVAQTLVVLVVTLAPALYWWLVLVPSERQSLAKNKRRGEVKEYLEQIEGDESRVMERWFYTDWLQQKGRESERRERNKQRGKTTKASASTTTTPSTSTTVEAVSTGSQTQTPAPPSDSSSGADEKEELEPFDETPYVATPNFFSGDNPILVTAVLISLSVAVGALVKKL